MSGAWRVQAACRQAPLDAPFAEPQSKDLRQFVDLYCGARCKVRLACLRYAMRAEANLSPSWQRFGVYGGLTGRERARLAQRLAARQLTSVGAR